MSKKSRLQTTPAVNPTRQEFRDLRIKRKRQQRRNLVIGLVALAVIVVALIAFSAFVRGSMVTVAFRAREQASGNAMGDPNAPVKIEEFSDYQCPFCQKFSDEIEPKIEEAYVKTGQVYFVYRSMGNYISENARNTESQDAAEAAYCAGDQGKYWEYHDMLFANFKGENVGSFTRLRLDTFAEKLGLNMDDFRACLDSNKHEATVQKDRADGRAAGVTSTPSFVINGKLIVGAQPFETFQKEIEAALEAAK
jgi:protein-disulfide isomerase